MLLLQSASASHPLPSPHARHHSINTTLSACISHLLHHQLHLSHLARLVQCISCSSSASAVQSVNLFTSPTHMFTLAYHHTQAHSTLQHPKTSHARWPSAARHEMPQSSSSQKYFIFAPSRHPSSSPATIAINHSVNHMASQYSCRAHHKGLTLVSVQDHVLTRHHGADPCPASSEYPLVCSLLFARANLSS